MNTFFFFFFNVLVYFVYHVSVFSSLNIILMCFFEKQPNNETCVYILLPLAPECAVFCIYIKKINPCFILFATFPPSYLPDVSVISNIVRWPRNKFAETRLYPNVCWFLAGSSRSVKVPEETSQHMLQKLRGRTEFTMAVTLKQKLLNSGAIFSIHHAEQR